jgi:hypothetical protein
MGSGEGKGVSDVGRVQTSPRLPQPLFATQGEAAADESGRGEAAG